MSLLAVTVGSDPSAVVDAVRAVGWYGVDVCHRLACSDGCYDALSESPDGVADGYCDTCGLRPVVEVSLYAQPRSRRATSRRIATTLRSCVALRSSTVLLTSIC